MSQIPNEWNTIILDTAAKREDDTTRHMLYKRKRTKTPGCASQLENTNNKRPKNVNNKSKNPAGDGRAENTQSGAQKSRKECNSDNEDILTVLKNKQKMLSDREVCKQEIKDKVLQTAANSAYKNSLKAIIDANVTRSNEHNKRIAEMSTTVSKKLSDFICMSKYEQVLSGVNTKSIVFTNELKFVSKAYEDTYLRQALGANEKPCVRGSDCECMKIDPILKFVGVKYKLPWESDAEDTNGLCLPCLRAATQALFLDIMHAGVTVNGLIQRFYNDHSRPGEYRLSAMLLCPPTGPVHNLPRSDVEIGEFYALLAVVCRTPQLTIFCPSTSSLSGTDQSFATSATIIRSMYKTRCHTCDKLARIFE